MASDINSSPALPSAEPVQQPSQPVTQPGRETTVFHETIALVANSIQVSDDVILPFELASGITFDRATPDEIDRFKALFPAVRGTSTMMSVFEAYECIRTIEQTPGGGARLLLENLPPKLWRYYVVRSDDNGNKNIDLTQVSLVTAASLDIGSIYLHGIGHGWSPYALVNLYSMSGMKETITITEANLRELGDVYRLKLFVAGNHVQAGPFPEIKRAFEMLNALRILPATSSFHVIGLFAILEMLITHNPELEDRGDSITRQMKSKIPLLSNRFDRPLPYHQFFGDTAHGAVWSKLYAYRSAYAHGGVPDFTRGPLVALRSEANANEFLRVVVQSIIRNSLKDPQLYRDIKEC
jgi:hypothetical protein